MKGVLIFFIRAYKLLISPLLPPSFYNIAIDERFEAVFDPTSSKRI